MGEVHALKDAVADVEGRIRELEQSRRFYLNRCDMLHKHLKRMREPERTLVCDILANCALLPDPDGKRYGAVDIPSDSKGD